MSLEKEFIRDGKRRIIGSVTSGFSDESAVVRDEDNKLSGPPANGTTLPATTMAIWSQSIRLTPVS
jgi:hypothetical protein